jgi:hypothetical protein
MQRSIGLARSFFSYLKDSAPGSINCLKLAHPSTSGKPLLKRGLSDDATLGPTSARLGVPDERVEIVPIRKCSPCFDKVKDQAVVTADIGNFAVGDNLSLRLHSDDPDKKHCN